MYKIMKKKFMITFLSLLCIFSLSACAGKKNTAENESKKENLQTEAETDNSDRSETKEDLSKLLDKITTANTPENLLANNSKVAYRITFYDADGTVTSMYTYQDADRYAYEYEGDVMIDESDIIYGFDSLNSIPYSELLIDTSHDEFAAANETLSGFVVSEGETVISCEEQDGVLLVTTSSPANDQTKSSMNVQGYQMSDNDSVEMVYSLEPDTYELLSYTASLCGTDGSNTVTSKMERVDNPETYVPDEQLHSQIFNPEKRTVTVTADPGTDQETTYSISVGVGCSVTIYSNEDLSFYLDEACTQPYEGSSDRNSDLNLYTVTG